MGLGMEKWIPGLGMEFGVLSFQDLGFQWGKGRVLLGIPGAGKRDSLRPG